MVAEEERALKFEHAIKQRLRSSDIGSTVVLDIGTGPWALLAIIAARAGAKHVYAIEANPAAARCARATIARASLSERITLVEGLSTAVTLPEKADLLVAEIVGSVATEEGILATLRDAKARHVKRPHEPSSYIPTAVATLAAPASHALHYVLAPPAFPDWIEGLRGQPVRAACSDSAIRMLALPAVIEELVFASELPPAGTWKATRHRHPLTFEISATQLAEAAACHEATLARERLRADDAAALASACAHSLSGVALWPRLQLDVEGKLVLEGRGARGEPLPKGATHWQTVLPLLAPRPVRVSAGDTVRVALEVDLPEAVDKPMTYSLRGAIRRS